jgi:hypothetical protein
MGIRRLPPDAFLSVDAAAVDPISFADFTAAFRIIRPSVSPDRFVSGMCVCVCTCLRTGSGGGGDGELGPVCLGPVCLTL